MGLKIISAEERLAEQKGVKALVLGPPGVGKTSLLKTLEPDRTLFIDFEAGDLAIGDLAVDQLRPQTWPECRDLACFLAGPDTNLPDDAHYSQRHYDEVHRAYGDEAALDKYDTLFVDSITVVGRMCLAWSEQQPEAFNKAGAKDTRGMYGLLGREMVAWITRLQHARTKNVVFVCLLDEKEDDFGRASWVPQIDGSKAGNALPGIVDEVITMAIMRPDDGAPYRAFVTHPDNEWGYPAKDRTGKLDPIERPDLGYVFAKLKEEAAQPASITASAATADTQHERAA